MTIASGQIYLPNGVLLGPGTNYEVESVEGLDPPEVRDSDIPKFADDGYFAGADYYERRVVRIKGHTISQSSIASMPTVLDDLRRAFNRTTPTLMPFKLNNDMEKAFYGSPRRLVWPTDSMANVGGYAPFVGEIVCPDPLIYSATEFSRSLLGAAPIVVSNGGTWPVKPVVTITGAGAGPFIITLGSASVRVDTSLTGGQVLIIDFPHRTITKAGVNAYDLKNSVTSWWSLAAGRNLLTLNQASLETDTTGWAVGSNCSISRSTLQASDGSASLALSATGAGAFMWATTPTLTNAIPVAANESYTFQAAFRAATVARNVYVQADWLDSSGALISQSQGAQVADTTTGWTTASLVATAPSTAVYVYLNVVVLNVGGAAEVHYVDKAGVTQGAAVPTWTVGAANIVTYSGGGASAILQWRWGWM